MRIGYDEGMKLSLWRLLVSIALLGLGLGLIICSIRTRSLHMSNSIICAELAYPLVGAGVFSLFRKTHWGLLLGIAADLLFIPALS